jgi:hypothetical protein
VAGEHDRVLPVAQRLAGGDADLFAYQVDAGDQLRYRMLDLDARVHLDEVVTALRVDEKLHGARAGVVDGAGHDEGSLVETGPGARGQARSR